MSWIRGATGCGFADRKNTHDLISSDIFQFLERRSRLGSQIPLHPHAPSIQTSEMHPSGSLRGEINQDEWGGVVTSSEQTPNPAGGAQVWPLAWGPQLGEDPLRGTCHVGEP